MGTVPRVYARKRIALEEDPWGLMIGGMCTVHSKGLRIVRKAKIHFR